MVQFKLFQIGWRKNGTVLSRQPIRCFSTKVKNTKIPRETILNSIQRWLNYRIQESFSYTNQRQPSALLSLDVSTRNVGICVYQFPDNQIKFLNVVQFSEGHDLLTIVSIIDQTIKYLHSIGVYTFPQQNDPDFVKESHGKSNNKKLSKACQHETSGVLSEQGLNNTNQSVNPTPLLTAIIVEDFMKNFKGGGFHTQGLFKLASLQGMLLYQLYTSTGIKCAQIMPNAIRAALLNSPGKHNDTDTFTKMNETDTLPEKNETVTLSRMNKSTRIKREIWQHVNHVLHHQQVFSEPSCNNKLSTQDIHSNTSTPSNLNFTKNRINIENFSVPTSTNGAYDMADAAAISLFGAIRYYLSRWMIHDNKDFLSCVYLLLPNLTSDTPLQHTMDTFDKYISTSEIDKEANSDLLYKTICRSAEFIYLKQVYEEAWIHYNTETRTSHMLSSTTTLQELDLMQQFGKATKSMKITKTMFKKALKSNGSLYTLNDCPITELCTFDPAEFHKYLRKAATAKFLSSQSDVVIRPITLIRVHNAVQKILIDAIYIHVLLKKY